MNKDYYLEYTKNRHIDKYNLIGQIFEAEKWLSLPDEVVSKLKLLDKEDSELAYLLLQVREKALSELKNWKNINTLEDIKNLKKILQQEYLESDKIDEIKKSQLLSALSFSYVDVKDGEFFKKVLSRVFANKNIYFLDAILRNSYDSLRYIQNMIIDTSNDLILIKNSKNKEIKILYKKNKLYSTTLTNISSLKAIDYLINTNIEFKDEYVIENPLFCDFFEKEIPCKININILEDLHKMEFVCSEQVLFEFDNQDYKDLSIVILSVLYEYQKRLDANASTVQDSFIVKMKNIDFKMFCSKKYNDYYLTIGNNKKIKFDIIEFANLFQKLFFFLTVYKKVKYNVCIKDELGLSNRDFLKLIGLKTF